MCINLVNVKPAMEFLSQLNYERKHCSVVSVHVATTADAPADSPQVVKNVDPNERQMSSCAPLDSSNKVGQTSNSSLSSRVLPGSMASKTETLELEFRPSSASVHEISIIMGQNYNDHGHPVSIMRFTNAEVNPGNWRKCRMVRDLKTSEMETTPRENVPVPETGAGSEYGAKVREETKQRQLMMRYGRKNLKLEDQPWYLRASSLVETKRFKGVKEGEVSSHASYFIFSAKQDGCGLVYEAFPVQHWYDFKCVPRRNSFTAEEAEEKFKKRNETYNFFSLIARKRMGIRDENSREEDKGNTKKKGKLIANEDNDNSSSDDENEKGGTSRKKKRGMDDFSFVNDNDDNEGEREVDYMSSSQTSSSEVDEVEEGNESEDSDDDDEEVQKNLLKLDSYERKRETESTKD